MAEILLLNPRARGKGSKMAKKRRSAAQRRATAKLVAMNRARKGRKARRSNPAPRSYGPAVSRRSRARRRNPVAAFRRRRAGRRSNPISMTGIMGPIKEAAIQGAGAVAMDMAFGFVNRYLPASLQRVPGQVGVGDAVKMLATVMLGRALRGPTKGISMKAATGALTVQFRDLTLGFFPQAAGSVAGLGYMVPGRVATAQTRVGPNRTRLSAYAQPGQSPLLSRYAAPGQTPLLSSAAREGYVVR